LHELEHAQNEIQDRKNGLEALSQELDDATNEKNEFLEDSNTKDRRIEELEN
jgi:hypothetical protein